MSYLTLFFAWLQMQGSQLKEPAWGYDFWTRVQGMNVGIFNFVWTLFLILLILGAVVAVFAKLRGVKLSRVLGCLGCLTLVLLFLPLGAWINMVEVQGIVNSISPTEGIVNATNFYVSLGLFLLFGIF